MSNERRKNEDKLDEAIDESFPASDPPANTVETGARVAPADVTAIDNRADSRFEVSKDGAVAFLRYERRPDSLVLVHTEVPEALRGQRIGDVLVKAALAAAAAEHLVVVAVCPFVRAYLKKHPSHTA